ncbi:MAG: RnfH family protein [Gammaproteobacteria bacterium]|nr:RnfH family protein [Gammaproteobacteria bacterium]
MSAIHIEVVFAKPERQWVVELELAAGATVNDALRAVAQREGFRELDLNAKTVGVWGRVIEDRMHVLADEDRVEIYRELTTDPMTARRERAAANQRRR